MTDESRDFCKSTSVLVNCKFHDQGTGGFFEGPSKSSVNTRRAQCSAKPAPEIGLDWVLDGGKDLAVIQVNTRRPGVEPECWRSKTKRGAAVSILTTNGSRSKQAMEIYVNNDYRCLFAELLSARVLLRCRPTAKRLLVADYMHRARRQNTHHLLCHANHCEQRAECYCKITVPIVLVSPWLCKQLH